MSIQDRARELQSVFARHQHYTYYHWRAYSGDTIPTMEFRPPFEKDYQLFIELERRVYHEDDIKVRISLRFLKDGRTKYTLTHFHGLDKNPFVDFYTTMLT